MIDVDLNGLPDHASAREENTHPAGHLELLQKVTRILALILRGKRLHGQDRGIEHHYRGDDNDHKPSGQTSLNRVRVLLGHINFL